MMISDQYAVERWTPAARATAVVSLAIILALLFIPLFASSNIIVKLTTLFIYILIACMWNALAGYGGLLSVGQQAFFGLGAYGVIIASNSSIPAYPSIVVGTLIGGLASLPLAIIMLRLKGGEFAIGMWVVAAVIHLLVNFDGLVQGETGISFIALNAFSPLDRLQYNYWITFAGLLLFLAIIYFILRSRLGAAIQAIRDDEVAASSVGVSVSNGRLIIFVVTAFGCAAAGALWLATAITFQPKTYFGINWTAYMIFMVLVGGIGTFEGPILGAILFFLLQDQFGDFGVWYLIVLGCAAIFFALFFPRGIWGTISDKWNVRLISLGFRVVQKNTRQ